MIYVFEKNKKIRMIKSCYVFKINDVDKSTLKQGVQKVQTWRFLYTGHLNVRMALKNLRRKESYDKKSCNLNGRELIIFFCTIIFMKP